MYTGYILRPVFHVEFGCGNTVRLDVKTCLGGMFKLGKAQKICNM